MLFKLFNFFLVRLPASCIILGCSAVSAMTLSSVFVVVVVAVVVLPLSTIGHKFVGFLSPADYKGFYQD